MALDSGALPVANPPDIARGDFNDAMTQLDAAFPLAAVNLTTDAVETVKIKDLNVTAAKLAVDSVETLKIKDKNVTSAKLADDVLSVDFIEAALVNKSVFFDDFLGSVLDDAWAQDIVGASAIIIGGNAVKLATGAVSGNHAGISWNGKKSIVLSSALPRFLAKLDARTGLTYLSHGIWLWCDGDKYIGFHAIDVAGFTPNWRAITRVHPNETNIDTGVPLKVTPQELKVVYESPSSVRFYIDDVEVAQSTAYIPTDAFELKSVIETQEYVAKDVLIDYCLLTQLRVRP